MLKVTQLIYDRQRVKYRSDLKIVFNEYILCLSCIFAEYLSFRCIRIKTIVIPVSSFHLSPLGNEAHMSLLEFGSSLEIGFNRVYKLRLRSAISNGSLTNSALKKMGLNFSH